MMNKFLLGCLVSLGIAAPVVAISQVLEDRSVVFDTSGTLEASDRLLTDGSYYDSYTLNGTAGQIVALSVTSEDFDTYVMIMDESGEQLIENDNNPAQTGTDSFLAFELPTEGQYKVLATSRQPEAVGQYNFFVKTGDPDLLTSQGFALYLSGELEEALAIFRRSLAIQSETASPETRAKLLSYIGFVHRDLGQYADAIIYLEDSLTLRKTLKNKSETAGALIHLGNLYSGIGDYQTSLDLYDQSLQLYQEVGDREQEGSALNNIALVHSNLNDYSKSLATYEQALAIAQTDSDKRGEGIVLGNMGGIFYEQGDYGKALSLYQQGLDISRDLEEPLGVAANLISIGGVYNRLGRYADTLSHVEEALAIAQAEKHLPTKQSALSSIGLAYDYLADHDKALGHYDQALAISKDMGDRNAQSSVLGNIGRTYVSLENYREALTFFEQSLAIAEEIGLQNTAAKTYLSMGGAYESLGETDKVVDAYEKALAISESIGNTSSIGESLNSLGHHYQTVGNHDRAIELYSQALGIMEGIGDRKGIAVIHNNIARSFDEQGEVEMSILFLKKSVNSYEAIRADLVELNTNLQTAYTDSIAYTYRQLADLMLQQNRVTEAQEVLDSLRVQEIEDYLNTKEESPADGIGYREPEKKIMALYQQLQQTATEQNQTLSQLNAWREADIITSDEEAQIQTLKAQQSETQQSFQKFATIDEVSSQLDQLYASALKESTAFTNTSLQRDLEINKAAMLEAVVFDNRLELLVTTTDDTFAKQIVVDVSREELDTAVQNFRAQLQDPKSDPKPLAQLFYRWLVEPIEKELAAAGIETIIYLPDDVLRYIPLAALHDGEQWLAQSMKVNNVTERSLSNLSALPKNSPKVLAGAFSDVSTRYVIEDLIFTGLPAAGEEVRLLDDMLPAVTALFNQSFSLETIESNAQAFNILHLATHATFNTSDPEASFILFGNGDTQTAKDISDWRLPNTDLVVLSACETGLGDFDNDGEQIAVLGYQFQESGAKAVMSSLWQVSDSGTQRLINAFYKGLSQKLSKNEAMHLAQRLFIENDLETIDKFIDTGRIESVSESTSGAVDAGSGAIQLDHPFYWAPFVLMGNGL